MSDLAIHVEGLGKIYPLARQRERYKTVRETVAGLFRRNGAARRSNREPFWALKDLSFEIRRGEVVGVIGRNGAGKSTLLKLLSRIIEPTEGWAEIHGRVGSLLEVGTGFHPELTGRENILLNGAILGMRRAEVQAKFDEIVAFAEVDTFIDTPVKHYSSGMYLRLAFAVAAHLEPDILLVDEVLAVGDAEFQKKCLGKMGEVAEAGRTVLFVSHNMTAVHSLCSRALLLQGGRASLEGSTTDVIGTYLSHAHRNEQGDFDLRTHAARDDRLTPVIRRVALLDAHGNPGSVFPCRSEFKAVIYLKLPEPLRDPRVAIAVEDPLNRRLFTAASYFEPAGTGVLEGEVSAVCSIHSLPLAPGRYLLSLSIGTKTGGLIDSVDGAAWFEVAADRVYHTSEAYLPLYGPILLDSRWHYVESAEAR